MKKGNCIYSFFMCINIKLSYFCYDIFIIMFYCCIVNIYMYVMIFYIFVLWVVYLFGICIIIFIIVKYVFVNEYVIII